MAKLGRLVTDPRAGSYCYVTVDAGEKLLVSHEKSGQKGRLTIALVKLWGLSSELLFAASIDSPDGQDILAHLTVGAARGCNSVRRADALPERR